MVAKSKYVCIRAVAELRYGEVTVHSNPPLMMLIVLDIPAWPFATDALTMALCGDCLPVSTHPSSCFGGAVPPYPCSLIQNQSVDAHPVGPLGSIKSGLFSKTVLSPYRKSEKRP